MEHFRSLLCFYIGIEIVSPRLGKMQAKAILILSSLDLPARALVTNMKQYNGICGCIYCEQEGTTTSGCSLHRWWPYRPSIERTHQTLMLNARQAYESRTAVSR